MIDFNFLATDDKSYSWTSFEVFIKIKKENVKQKSFTSGSIKEILHKE